MASALKCMKAGCSALRVGHSNYCEAHRPGAVGVKVAAKKVAAKKLAARKKAAARKTAARKVPAKKA